MKKTQMLPLAAIISGLLVGCGGGGGGGGGGGASKTTFTFDFAIPATLFESEANAQNCTVYDRDTDLNGDATVLTYSQASTAQVTNNVIGYYSDADGKIVGEVIKPTSDNFQFVLEDIPEGGYITVQALEFNGREVRVNSFSREFLEDKELRNVTFALNRESLNKCFTGSNESDKTFKNLSYRNAVSGGGDYHYVSQKDVLVSSNNSMTSDEELLGLTGEPTVLFQYQPDLENESLHQYGIGSWGTSDIELVTTDVVSSIYSSSGYNYDSLNIGFVANDYLYDALELGNSVDEYRRPSEAKQEEWVYLAVAENATNGWDSLLTGTIDSSWDIDADPSALLNINNLPNSKPSVISQSGRESVIDIDMGLTSSTEGFARTAYFAASGDYKVTHRIFTRSNSDYVVVPELDYYNFPSSAVNGLKVSETDNFNRSAIILDENSDIDSEMFMSFFSNGESSEPELEADLDGILTSEKDGMESEVTLRTSKSLVVKRFN
ncbi:54K polar flagellar sheath protein A [Vibrio coralliirubri]|uniref:54K polar flagellar sheath protein A n=1 Tax=Vibrio coralliirubri TaxID=1516159 RepID=UPI002FCFC7FC